MIRLAAFLCLIGGTAAANPLLDQVTDIWQSGAEKVAGQTLPAPQISKSSVMFDCGKCDLPFVALLQEDTLTDTFGTTDPDEVIALMGDCGDVDCTLAEFTFEGLRAVEYAYTVLETEAVTARYFRDSGRDLILVVLQEIDEGRAGQPLVRAFEASYVRPLLVETAQ